MNKFWFKFFGAAESNCSSDCMYVCSEFLSDSHFIVTACINQWIIVIYNNNILNKFWFKFFWAAESNCSDDCMYVCSEFLSDSHFIVTACINQWIIVIYNNNILNKFWFKFFWAAESNCSDDCMYVCSEFLSDSHFIVTACINQWIIVIYNNNILNKFWFKFFLGSGIKLFQWLYVCSEFLQQWWKEHSRSLISTQ